MIQFINVSKAYKQHNVLENINLSINEGELVVLIGPSGCGKTTLLKMINRLIDPTAGQILINGTDIIAQDPIELRRNMGYVIQQTGLFVHMTVRENIEIVPHLAKLPQDEIVERTVKLMEMVGLPQEFLDRYPNHLSGGQQQRIGVARAFAMDPGIILMDEPFVGLDPIAAHELKKIMAEHCRNGGAIFFSTHVLEVAEKLCDNVAIIKNGKLIAHGTMDSVRGDGSLEQVFLELEDHKD